MSQQRTGRFVVTCLVVFAMACLGMGIAGCAPKEPTAAPREQPPPAKREAPKPAEKPAAREPVQVERQSTRIVEKAAEAVPGAPHQAPESSRPKPIPPRRRPRQPDEAPPDDMFFENYGVNPFIDTEDDHLSTFATDVDTGAYTLARSYVQDGHRPPEDAIRVEEFVNYFDQDYRQPPAGEAFAIHVDGAPFPFAETERYRMMRVGIQGYRVPPEERKDVSLTFVIDTSGSMARENRLGLVKGSLEYLVEALRPSDTVAIVAYGSSARTVLEPTSVSKKRVILRAIRDLRSGGSTNAAGGLLLGYRWASQALEWDVTNRVILCSDGVANVGLTQPDQIWRTVEDYASEGITLATVGVGMGNYNDTLMEQLADRGDGFYAYVDSLAEAQRLFVEDLTGTLQCIAMDAKVQVNFNPEVVARYRLVGFENRAVADEDFRDDTVDAGEIGAGHCVTALYEIKLHPNVSRRLPADRIATVHLRWRDPDSETVLELSESFDTNEMARSFVDSPPRFQLCVVVAEYAEILRGSYWAEGSTLGGVVEEAEQVSRLLRGDEDVQEFVQLVKRAAGL